MGWTRAVAPLRTRDPRVKPGPPARGPRPRASVEILGEAWRRSLASAPVAVRPNVWPRLRRPARPFVGCPRPFVGRAPGRRAKGSKVRPEAHPMGNSLPFAEWLPRPLTLLLLVTLTAGPASAVQSRRPTPPSSVGRAEDFALKQKWSEAAKAWTEVTTANPTNGRYWRSLAAARRHLSDVAGAVAAEERAIALGEAPANVAAVPTALGFGVALRCVWSFGWTGRGTPAPVAPPQRLVVVGFYRYVRNPMYLGFFVGGPGCGHSSDASTRRQSSWHPSWCSVPLASCSCTRSQHCEGYSARSTRSIARTSLDGFRGYAAGANELRQWPTVHDACRRRPWQIATMVRWSRANQGSPQ
jgi:hypothetical protein